MFPMTWIALHANAFIMMSLLNICAFVFVNIFFVRRFLEDEESLPLTLAVSLISFISYPFLFELERGQSNLIAMSLALGALYLYQQSKNKYLSSYILLTLAVQLKVYPLVFIFALFNTQKTWKSNFFKHCGFIIINFLLFFSLGIEKAKHFFHTLLTKLDGGVYNREINMSLSCYFKLASSVLEKLTVHSTDIIQVLKLITFLIIGISFCYLVWRIYQGKLKGWSADFILAATLLTLLLPGVSHDYKLSYLAGPLVIFLYRNRERVSSLILGILYFLFCSTLWHFWDHKQGPFLLTFLFKVNTPSLVMLYFVVIFLNVKARPEIKSN